MWASFFDSKINFDKNFVFFHKHFWDRCYDFLNIFAEKIGEKIGEKIAVFDSKQSFSIQKYDHNIGFCEKKPIFCRKLSKIAENCDHNIDPWSHWLHAVSDVQLSSWFIINSIWQVM
jgi:hypothetical protein